VAAAGAECLIEPVGAMGTVNVGKCPVGTRWTVLGPSEGSDTRNYPGNRGRRDDEAERTVIDTA